MKCRYCGEHAEFVKNERIYNGKRFGKSYMTWWCEKCDASIGVHKNDPMRPLGEQLASAELRKRKSEVKKKFVDKMLGGTWDCPLLRKQQAYRDLAYKLNIDTCYCHFGMFESKMLDRVEKILDNYNDSNF